MLSKSTCIVLQMLMTSRFPVYLFQNAIHKTGQTKKSKSKIMLKSESRILKKVEGFFSLGKWSSNGFATTTRMECTVTFANTLGVVLIMSCIKNVLTV